VHIHPRANALSQRLSIRRGARVTQTRDYGRLADDLEGHVAHIAQATLTNLKINNSNPSDTPAQISK
jgi:hypothetical protein